MSCSVRDLIVCARVALPRLVLIIADHDLVRGGRA
jgi:hypothetical protein